MRLQNGMCNGDDPTLKLYPAYYNYGAWLEARGNVPDAIKAYQNALAVNPQGEEAAKALRHRHVLTPARPPTCPDKQVTDTLTAVPMYTPQMKSSFIRVKNSAFVLGNDVYHVRGINYYPVRAPWKRFLAEADLGKVAQELALIHKAGFNMVRIFLWYDGLFDCAGSGAVPKPGALARLDGVLKLAAQNNLRVIVTLNDLPDLLVRPLYTSPGTAAVQTAYLVSRYRDEPAILAWDVRNEGDIDYARNGFSPVVVLDWLVRTVSQVRKLDPNHLITAGWKDGALATESVVDFLSFHHYSAQESLRLRSASFKAASQKPILLEEIGFSTLGVDENQQGMMLREALSASDAEGRAGWVIWTASDFPTDVPCLPPACPSKDNGEHHFGLWPADYTPNPAVELLK